MYSEEQKRLLAQKLFTSMKSKQKNVKSSTNCGNAASSKSKQSVSSGGNKLEKDNDLTRRAVEEICRNTDKVAKIADEIGPSAWRMKKTSTNKRFLTNTVRSVLNHNERTTTKHAEKSKKKFDELSKRKPKFGDRVHSFQSRDERLTKRMKEEKKSLL